MTTEHEESWVLIKPDSYLAIPASAFSTLCGTMKNIKEEWSSGRGEQLEMSKQAMAMKLVTHDQMTALIVRNRVIQSSEPAQ